MAERRRRHRDVQLQQREPVGADAEGRPADQNRATRGPTDESSVDHQLAAGDVRWKERWTRPRQLHSKTRFEPGSDGRSRRCDHGARHHQRRSTSGGQRRSGTTTC